MLSPQDISGKVFVKAVFGGYDMTSVDDFLESVSADYSSLYKENAILKSKIKVLVEKVEEYRSTEDAMRMALLTAQRMGEDIMTEATKKGNETLARADEEIKFKLRDMNERLADEEARLKAAKVETAKFVDAAEELLRRHANFLARLEKLRHGTEPEPVEDDVPAREEQKAEPARAVDAAIGKTMFSTTPKAPQPDGEDGDEAIKQYVIKNDKKPREPAEDQEQDPGTPRPKFDFDNLKFGVNFNGDE